MRMTGTSAMTTVRFLSRTASVLYSIVLLLLLLSCNSGSGGRLGQSALVQANRITFSIHDDLLGFPQFEVDFPDSLIPESEALERLLHNKNNENAPTSETQDQGDDGKDGESFTSEEPDHAKDEAKRQQKDLPRQYVQMVHQDRDFLCAVPVVPSAQRTTNKNDDKGNKNSIRSNTNAAIGDGDDSNTNNVNGAEDEAAAAASAVQSAADAAEQERLELARATHHGAQLLREMRGMCAYYLDGWWSYSFCYGDRIRQFHQLAPSQGVPSYPPQEDTSVPAFDLGVWPEGAEGAEGAEGHGGGGGAEGGGRGGGDGGGKTDVGERKRGHKNIENVRLETQGERRYLVQRLRGGSICDLTGRERTIEVQYHCRPQIGIQIGAIKEISTCSYLMLIYTPRLCDDVVFLPPVEVEAHAITCQEVIPDNEFEMLKAQDVQDAGKAAIGAAPGTVVEDGVLPKQEAGADDAADSDTKANVDDEAAAAEKNKDQGEAEEAQTNEKQAHHHELSHDYPPSPPKSNPNPNSGSNPHPPLPESNPFEPVVIGGTTVGARKLVGDSKSRTIEKSLIVSGGAGSGAQGGAQAKETFVETVASSDGRRLSDAEMKKLRIVNVKDVDKVIRNLKKVADGKGWRLDVVDTPRGREFRGVVEADGKGGGERGRSGSRGAEKGKGGSEDGGRGRNDSPQKQGDAGEDGEEQGSEEVYKDEL